MMSEPQGFRPTVMPGQNHRYVTRAYLSKGILSSANGAGMPPGRYFQYFYGSRFVGPGLYLLACNAKDAVLH